MIELFQTICAVVLYAHPFRHSKKTQSYQQSGNNYNRRIKFASSTYL